MIPQEPAILLSWVNTQLRDRYLSLSILCEDMEVEESAISSKLDSLGYHYDPAQNQFR